MYTCFNYSFLLGCGVWYRVFRLPFAENCMIVARSSMVEINVRTCQTDRDETIPISAQSRADWSAVQKNK